MKNNTSASDRRNLAFTKESGYRTQDETVGSRNPNLIDWVNLQALLRRFEEEKKSLRVLGGNTSVEELYLLLLDALSVIKHFMDGELPMTMPNTPDKIIGETGPDGTIQSRNLKTESILTVDARRLRTWITMIEVIVITLKDGMHLGEEVQAQAVREKLVKFFPDFSAIYESSRSTKKTSLAIEDEKEIKFHPKGGPLPSYTDLSYNDRIRANQFAITSMIKKHGLSFLPKDLRVQIKKANFSDISSTNRDRNKPKPQNRRRNNRRRK